jgi:membrane protein DedA with SNARE-associated domain/membrane-associated phospholipid phosphatase
MGHLQTWLDHYGYFVLSIALALEMLALPLPGEVLMSYAGLLIFQGKLNWLLCILSAWAGSSIGVTLSYWLGFHLGPPFFEKYGSKIHFGPEKLEKTSHWFERYGNKLLAIAYFIPGLRHVTGYFSGITRIPFRTYMLYAYTGAFLWTGTFISLGKVLGPKWEQFHHSMNKYLMIAGLIAAVIFLLAYLYRKYRPQMAEAAMYSLKKGVNTFHSLGRVKFLMAAAFVLFLGFFALMVGLIQDFLADEFADFDAISSFIVHTVFDEHWSGWMSGFAYLASFQVLLSVFVVTFLWVLFRGKDRFLEIGSLFFVLVGGGLWDEGLRRLFHRTGPGNLADTFPSEQTLITIIVLGFAAYLFARHIRAIWIRTAAPLIVIAASLLVGVSRIYFDVQYPSDVAAGYVFGGVWLSLNMILLEVLRLLRTGDFRSDPEKRSKGASEPRDSF